MRNNNGCDFLEKTSKRKQLTLSEGWGSVGDGDRAGLLIFEGETVGWLHGGPTPPGHRSLRGFSGYPTDPSVEAATASSYDKIMWELRGETKKNNDSYSMIWRNKHNIILLILISLLNKDMYKFKRKWKPNNEHEDFHK